MQPPQFLGPGPLGQQHSPPHPKQPPPTPRPALRAAPLVGFSPSPLSLVRGFSTLSWGWLSLCLNTPPPHTMGAPRQCRVVYLGVQLCKAGLPQAPAQRRAGAEQSLAQPCSA